MMKVDRQDKTQAFYAGFRYGRETGLASPREADAALQAGRLSTDGEMVEVFCNGADDGARGDYWRLALTYVSYDLVLEHKRA